MKKQAVNPILPVGTYIPDVEPHVFSDRIYLYGSHDKENGETFCMLDYEVWSAPVDDLGNWSCKGVSYKADQDPLYQPGNEYMYAPDCVRGNDGRYYLYYCLAGYRGKNGYSNPISVAVCDTPDGRFEFYGHVKDKNGRPFMDKLCFDPAVINDDGTIRLYFGSDLCWLKNTRPKILRRKIIAVTTGRKLREINDDFMGSFTAVLRDDMLTIDSEVVRIDNAIEGDEYRKHPFFEGSSIRKVNNTYYFIYSSFNNHELCYATSKYPDRDFRYGGTIVSNGDIGYEGRKDEDRLNHTGTNHGSIEKINGQWYVFYHRLTHNSDYSRQVCAEKIEILGDGRIPQVQITSCGLNDGPLLPGRYPAVICCNLSNGRMKHASNQNKETSEPNISSADEERFIKDISEGTLIAYKYFALEGNIRISLLLRGDQGSFDIELGDRKVSALFFEGSPQWRWTEQVIEDIEKGEYCLNLRYKGTGKCDLKEIEIEERI